MPPTFWFGLILIECCRTVQKTLRDLKMKISTQSKKNFVLEKDVRYLDSRIALLIQNRMALEEVWTSYFPSKIWTDLLIRSIAKRGCQSPRRHSRTTRRVLPYRPEDTAVWKFILPTAIGTAAYCSSVSTCQYGGN